ncbi:MAG: prepilin-type N-terminal cleavage/methylation domain-containing protein [Gammaproteobacteria bacterium]|nr:prepilin-type N-terminal cleavage/methylation domain-containing protein [Gammaproteobacteria bacterium]
MRFKRQRGFTLIELLIALV